MNTQAAAQRNTLRQVKVNDGTVQDSEQPLWVGMSKVTDDVNGRLVTMSITLDRDWLWVRFSKKASEKYRKQLISAGFIWSNKRQGWHGNVNELACKLMRDFGALTIDHYVLAKSVPPKPVEKVTGNLDLDAQVEKPESIKKPKKEKQPKTSEKPEKKNEPEPQATPSNDTLTATLLERLAKVEETNAKLTSVLELLVAKLAG